MSRKEFSEIAWEFARTVATVDKQLLSTSAVEAITDMLMLAYNHGTESRTRHTEPTP